MKRKILNDKRGIIQITYNTGEVLQHFYKSLKELKEFKSSVDAESFKIIKPLEI